MFKYCDDSRAASQARRCNAAETRALTLPARVAPPFGSAAAYPGFGSPRLIRPQRRPASHLDRSNQLIRPITSPGHRLAISVSPPIFIKSSPAPQSYCPLCLRGFVLALCAVTGRLRAMSVVDKAAEIADEFAAGCTTEELLKCFNEFKRLMKVGLQEDGHDMPCIPSYGTTPHQHTPNPIGSHDAVPSTQADIRVHSHRRPNRQRNGNFSRHGPRRNKHPSLLRRTQGRWNL